MPGEPAAESDTGISGGQNMDQVSVATAGGDRARKQPRAGAIWFADSGRHGPAGPALREVTVLRAARRPRPRTGPPSSDPPGRRADGGCCGARLGTRAEASAARHRAGLGRVPAGAGWIRSVRRPRSGKRGQGSKGSGARGRAAWARSGSFGSLPMSPPPAAALTWPDLAGPDGQLA